MSTKNVAIVYGVGVSSVALIAYVAISIFTAIYRPSSTLSDLSEAHRKATGSAASSIRPPALKMPSLPGHVSPEQACKATISFVFKTSPSIINTYSAGSTIRLWYTRPDDGKRWEYVCKIDGDRVFYSSANSPGGPYFRRAEQIRVKANDDRLTVTERYSDGSKSSFRYYLNDL